MKKNSDFSKPELFYESMAGNFDNLMSQYEVEKRLRIIFFKILKDKNLKNKTFLDAGCGTGLFSQIASTRGAKVTSLDVGPKLLKAVAKKCQSKRVVGSIMKLPFKDNSFDFVLSTEVIEHIPNPRKGVEELLRVAKPGGLVIITTPNKLWRFTVNVADWLKIRPYHGFENWNLWWELENWLNKNGGQIKDKFGFNILPFFHPVLQPLINLFDSWGKLFGPVMVNMAFVVEKKK